MILQNRKGFDQLFLKQGGLCVGLGEELYEYADYTGIVREIIAELRKRLQVRHLEKEQSQVLLTLLTQMLVERSMKEGRIRHRLREVGKCQKQICLLQKLGRYLYSTLSISLAPK